jgi:predicted phosphodiesterase
MKTKIAVITDVHGNAPALRAVLAELEQEDGLSHIYGVGDYIGVGPDTNEVLELLFALPTFVGIAGNHEDCILALLAGDPPGSPPGLEEHHEWVANELDRRFLPELQALPRVLSPLHGDLELFIAHYHLDTEQKLMPIDQDPTLNKLEAHYDEHHAAVVLTGHHHDGHFLERPGRVYLNPGALGCGPDPVARYAVLTLSEDGIDVQRREAAYDRESYLKVYEQRAVPDRAFILERFHGQK